MSLAPLRTGVKRWATTIGILLPLMTAIAGGVWTVQKYYADALALERERDGQAREQEVTRRREEKRIADTRLLEAQKPFLEKQLALYFETARVVGILVTAKPNEPPWEEAERRFWALYWSELAMVEHKLVEAGMARFGGLLHRVKSNPEDGEARQALYSGAYDLAHAIRAGIEDAWNVSPRVVGGSIKDEESKN